MTSADDPRTADPTPDEAAAGDTAVAEAPAADSGRRQMKLDVQITPSGPCRKHIRVCVPREELDRTYEDIVGEYAGSAVVPGFRKGHVPSKLVEKRFKKELHDQVKQRVLVGSLEQVSESEDLDPINEPDLDAANIEIPEEGDFVYEFDIEVRPEFDIPAYDGLQIDRPVREIGPADVDAYLDRFLDQYAELVPHEGAAEKGDYLVLDVAVRHGDALLAKIDELTVRAKPVLRFQDAEIPGFDALVAGAAAGDKRHVHTVVSQEAARIDLRGEPLHVDLEILDVKRRRLPELDAPFLERIGFGSVEDLREQVGRILERQLQYQQRQLARRQVLDKITASADWDLPEKLVARQIENALYREVLEMQQAGFTTPQIRARENELRQQAISTTRQALKEHFVLDKIANTEKIEVSPADIDEEIRLMAMQRGESPRRVRARLQKSGVIENLEAQIRERKAVDVILSHATFVDVPAEPFVDTEIEAVSRSLCGAAVPSAAPAEPPAAE